ncbi:MAG: DUF5110 domain-containing protein, partial [Hymenobacteraceae bacterium]|nr:DUF5110 domain-containing protein [Hymenobacteraceae bacterium]
TGDNIASWEHMWLANIQCQRLSISGVSFTGSDVGGFIDQPTGELFARWLALAGFHPFMRVHSSGDHGEQEPWSFGDRFTALARRFIELRYELLPALYTAFWQYATRGTPMLRPLVYLDQDDPETYQRMAEFSLGDHLLVCPITQADAEGRWLYLPTGQWYYWYTNEVKEGQQEIWADAGLDRIPLFVRAGAVVPTWPVRQHSAAGPPADGVTLHVYWKSGTETTELYEDAGEGYAYAENAESCLKTLTVNGTERELICRQTTAGAYCAPHTAVRLVLHGLPFAPSALVVDGATYEIAAGGPAEATIPATFREVRVTGAG